VLGHAADLSIFGNRVRVPPWGLDGGLDGAPAEYTLGADTGQPAPAAPQFGSKAAGVRLRDGELVTQATAGGGGWGDPTRRAPELVARDVRLGYVSAEAAQRDYGVVVGDDGELDDPATRRLRDGGAA
jgi:N-methylhydantoinase B